MTGYNVSGVRELLRQHGFNLSKSMGQNFLVDANIPEKIVKLAGIKSTYGVLEVGPGIGALTSELCKAAGFVTAVELDKRLVPILKNTFASTQNVKIVQGDIMKLDINRLVSEIMPDMEHHVCANLPYNITTPVISAFIEAGVFSSITVMIQKEVAQRICALPGSREYGAFSVYANYHTKPQVLFDVSPECFFPQPKVTSTVLKMVIRKEKRLSEEEEIKFFRVVKASFGQRRKTLVNALYAVFEKTHSKEELTKIITDCGFDERIRGEVLGIDEFMRISSVL